MFKKQCENAQCPKWFDSIHSTTKYCSRSCAAKVNIRKRIALGDKPGKKKNPSDEVVLEMLKEFAKHLGKPPTRNEVRSNPSMPSSALYIYRFGSWAQTLEKIGLPSTRRRQVMDRGKCRHVPLGLRYQILQRDGHRCKYCGGTPEKGFILEVDHVVPVASGGNTTLDNLVTACELCNSGKSDMTIEVGNPAG